MFPVGGRVREFELVELLSSHGGEAVFHGRDPEGTEAVVKAVDPLVSGDGEAFPRFLRESKIHRQLRHPHIARLLAYGVQDGIHFLVLERVRGRSLSDLLRQHGAGIGVGNAALILRQLMSALAHAHEQGVVHRDLRPENVVLDEEGSLQLAGFGTAAAPDLLLRTSGGAVLGAFHYSSPEQNTGRPVTPVSDLYAAGLLLWELLTGEQAIPENNLVDAVERQQRDGIPSPSLLAPGVPAPLEDLCTRLLRADPAARPASAQAVLRELEVSMVGSARRSGRPSSPPARGP